MLRMSAITHRVANMHARRHVSANAAIGAPVAELVTQFKEANVTRGAVYTHVRPIPPCSKITALYAYITIQYNNQ